MNETARTLAIAACLGVSIAYFIIGANASPDRGRALLGKRAAKYESLDPEEFGRAVRAAHWGLPGIAFVLLVGALYWGLAGFGPTFKGRMWMGFVFAALVGIVISQVQRILLRTGIERHLEKRLTP
jgi:hypothetical protein